MTHVLIIDDNGTGIDVLGTLLDTQNITYTGTQDPTQVREIISKSSVAFDIIFVDLEMPNINGYEMLSILKKELGLKMPIIAYSVHTSELHTARELGFDGFLGKPIDRHIFPEQIQKILDGEQIWDSN